jgi:hypothetical protein
MMRQWSFLVGKNNLISRTIRQPAMKIKIAFVVVLILAACSNLAGSSGTPNLPEGTPAITPTLPSLDLVPLTPATSELMSISGSGPGSSGPFAITGKSMVRVNWQQSSTGKFVLAVINTDPAQAGTPYGRIIFESVTGPSAMVSDYELIAGQYTIAIEMADGPWKVWVQYLGPGK